MLKIDFHPKCSTKNCCEFSIHNCQIVLFTKEIETKLKSIILMATLPNMTKVKLKMGPLTSISSFDLTKFWHITMNLLVSQRYCRHTVWTSANAAEKENNWLVTWICLASIDNEKSEKVKKTESCFTQILFYILNFEKIILNMETIFC